MKSLEEDNKKLVYYHKKIVRMFYLLLKKKHGKQTLTIKHIMNYMKGIVKNNPEHVKPVSTRPDSVNLIDDIIKKL